jgi:hypothetical protein
MKHTITILALILTFQLSAQQVKTSGKWLLGENKGKSFILASDEYLDLYLGTVAAYNAGDAEKEISFYETVYGTKNKEFTTNWHASTEKVINTPAVILPVRLQGSEDAMVLAWSTENRLWKNGSTQKMSLMEVYTFDKDKKINDFSQWYRVDPKNEFGLPLGGKFFGKTNSEYTGRSLVFSNRGEVAVIEQLMEDYNNKNPQGFVGAFAEGAVIEGIDGEVSTISIEMLNGYFDTMITVSWTPYAIVPLKIYDTDPASGVTVFSREIRTGKDGSVWDKELVENFYFNVDGKIDRVIQFSRGITKQ